MIQDYKTHSQFLIIFTFCAFLPYNVGPPVSSVVISYLKQKLHMNAIDKKPPFVGFDLDWV